MTGSGRISREAKQPRRFASLLRTWLLGALLSITALGSAHANELVLLGEAATLLQQTETPDLAQRGALFEQARQRLQRIVAEHPNTEVARQLREEGVPFSGGRITLADVTSEARLGLCYAAPSFECLIAIVRAYAEALPFEAGTQFLPLLAETLVRVGAPAEAERTFEQARAAAMSAPLRLSRVDPERAFRELALGRVARAQSRSGFFTAALANVREVQLSNLRSEILIAIAEDQGRRGSVEDAMATSRMLTDQHSRSTALVAVVGALARSGREQEAMHHLREIMDEAQNVRALVAIGEAQRASGRDWAAVFDRARRTAREINPSDVPGGVLALSSIAAAYARAGRIEDASVLFTEAVQRARRATAGQPDFRGTIDDPRSRGALLAVVAIAQLDAGLFEAGVATTQEIQSNNMARYRALSEAVRGYVEAGRFDEARALLETLGLPAGLTDERRIAVVRAHRVALGRAGRTAEALADDAGWFIYDHEVALAAAEGLRRPRRPTGSAAAIVPAEPSAAHSRLARTDEATQTATASAPPATAQAPATAIPPSPVREPLRGAAQVISTGILVVAGERVTLAYIEGLEGIHARGLAAFIASRSGTVTCERAPSGDGMRCLTTDAVDVATAALFNGGARTISGAPPEYRAAEVAAREARRGIWAEASGAVGPTAAASSSAPRDPTRVADAQNAALLTLDDIRAELARLHRGCNLNEVREVFRGRVSGHETSVVVVLYGYEGCHGNDWTSTFGVFSDRRDRIVRHELANPPRWQVQNVAVQDGAIRVSGLEQGPNDPRCCPTIRRSADYTMANGRVVVRSARTPIDDHAPRSDATPPVAPGQLVAPRAASQAQQIPSNRTVAQVRTNNTSVEPTVTGVEARDSGQVAASSQQASRRNPADRYNSSDLPSNEVIFNTIRRLEQVRCNVAAGSVVRIEGHFENGPGQYQFAVSYNHQNNQFLDVSTFRATRLGANHWLISCARVMDAPAFTFVLR